MLLQLPVLSNRHRSKPSTKIPSLRLLIGSGAAILSGNTRRSHSLSFHGFVNHESRIVNHKLEMETRNSTRPRLKLET